MSEKCVLFFEKSEVIFTKWCFIFVLFFDKSDYDHCLQYTLLLNIGYNSTTDNNISEIISELQWSYSQIGKCESFFRTRLFSLICIKNFQMLRRLS